ncbi:MAG: hypothetical protein N2512_08720 [Armatimonadetes bacterium]|nr:hypothetical protein [Armatimonadota bacterium]
MRTLVAVAVFTLVAAIAWAQEGQGTLSDEEAQAFRLKAGYADLGDLSGGWTAALEYEGRNCLLSAGWAEADGTLRSGASAFEFDGNYYFAEAAYIYRPPNNPLTYVGAGAGLYRLDGDFRQTQPTTATSSGHDNSLGVLVVVGTESADRRWFGELRWVLGTDHWDWDADGLRAYIGMRF